MARIVGNLSPQDDYTHALGPESNFNESMYFNFFDRERGIGGFIRLGNRANEGNAERTVALFLPDGRVLFTFKRAPIDDNEAFDAGGARFEVLEPAQRLRTCFEGRVLELREPREMAEPRKAFAENPLRALRLELVHDAVGPMYGSAGSHDEEKRPSEEQFARAHYEQHMHVVGAVEVEDERFEIDGFGLRDHSWGPRFWQAIERYEWLTMNFGRDFGAMISVVQRDADHVRRGGVVVRGDELELVKNVFVEADYEANGLYHSRVRTRFETLSGETFEISGDVRGFIPLRNRREGLVTHIGEGMTEWRCGDRRGYGLSEFLRQV